MKKKFTKFLSLILVGFIAFNSVFIQNVDAAKLYESLFWGITANFDSGSFEGVIVIDDDGKFDEAYHSVARQTDGATFNVAAIRFNDQDISGDKYRGVKGTGANGITTIKKWSSYMMFLAQGEYVTTIDGCGGLCTHVGSYSSWWGAADSYSIRADRWKNSNKEHVNWGDYANAAAQVMAWTQSWEYNDAKRWICKNFTGNTIFGLGAAWEVASPDGGWSNQGHNQCKGREYNAIYTWPGIVDAKDVTSEDEEMLNWVSSTLINNYNKAIAFLLNNADKTKKMDLNSNAGRAQFLDFAVQVAYAARNHGEWDNDEKNATYKTYIVDTGELKIKYQTVAVTEAEYRDLDIYEPGTSKEDFVKFIVVDGDNEDNYKEVESEIVRWKVPKGYGSGQRLDGFLVGRGVKAEKLDPMTTELTFDHVVYQAMFNYYTTGQTSASADEFYAGQADWLERQVVGLLDNIIKGIERMLGLYSFEELMMNRGSRGVRYWQGVVPSSWLSASQYFYLFTYSLSMIILLIALVKLAFTKSVSAIGNAAKKVSLMEGIKKIIISAFLVILFQPIFYILCQLNVTLVSTVGGLVTGEVLFNTSSLSGGGTLASSILSFVFFFITLKMNFTYMMRGITVLICYLLGPICLMVNALGDRWGDITSNWLKELLGNLFIQTIHALVLCLFITVSRYGTQASIEKIVLVYSFVPLTEFVRTNLFALGKGLDEAAGNLATGVGGAVTSVGVGAAGAVLSAGTGLVGAGVNKFRESRAVKNGTAPLDVSKGKLGGVSSQLDKASVGVKAKDSKPKENSFGKLQPGRAAKNLGMAGARAVGNALPGVAMGALNTMAGIASGATNAQGRMNSMALAGGMRQLSGAVANLPGDIGNNYADELSRYNSGVDNYNARNEIAAEEAPFTSEAVTNHGFGYDSASDTTFVDNSKLGNYATGKNASQDPTISRITAGPGGRAIADCTVSKNSAIGKELTQNGVNIQALAKNGITQVKVDRATNSVSYKQEMPGYTATPSGDGRVKIQGDISTIMSNSNMKNLSLTSAKAANKSFDNSGKQTKTH